MIGDLQKRGRAAVVCSLTWTACDLSQAKEIDVCCNALLYRTIFTP
jgi:hypothetical protein